MNSCQQRGYCKIRRPLADAQPRLQLSALLYFLLFRVHLRALNWGVGGGGKGLLFIHHLSSGKKKKKHRTRFSLNFSRNLSSGLASCTSSNLVAVVNTILWFKGTSPFGSVGLAQLTRPFFFEFLWSPPPLII